MRVLMLSKALVVGQYQEKARLLAARPGIELTVIVPPAWRDERGALTLERSEHEQKQYDLHVAPLRFNGHYHLSYYPTIGRVLAECRPDILHLDEEPYNLATFHALYAARQACPNARALFFTWQNLRRIYPPPFSTFEKYVYRHSDRAIAGNEAAVDVLRSKGFQKPVRVIPQFGVDPETFTPQAGSRDAKRFVIGWAGRLVPEKGAAMLLRAAAGLAGDWELRLVGSGPARADVQRLAASLGIAGRVHWLDWQPSDRMPGFYRSLDVLVAPSLARTGWTEQFGRVLVEAMACGTPVIGSDSGEIPNVIGDAGVIIPEGNVQALSAALSKLHAEPALQREYGRRGRARVLERYTQQRIADETFEVYSQLMARP